MTKNEKSDLFKRLFDTADGKTVLGILKEDLGYERRTSLAENDRLQCYVLGRANAVQYILDVINQRKKKPNKNGRKSESEPMV